LTRKLKILITDDSLLLRRKLKQELESLDCEVFEAKNGKEAVIMYLENQPDGTFLDIVMPEVGGLDALKAIRKINEKAQVVMLSSTGTSSKLVETLKFGAIDFIQKPYTTQQIKKTLDDIRKKVEADA